MSSPFFRRFLFAAAVLSVGACTTAPKKEAQPSAPGTKYYKDDGPGENPPPGLEAQPDAAPRIEPLNRFANRPYTVFGREYVPATSLRPYKERGIASWYGRKFHGEKTSSGEVYDMYAMTAAHPTLPIPSYARVTNVATGKSVVVRVNDRGPFLHNRVIDLSYAAATKIGIAQKGSGEVEVEAIIPIETATVAAAAPLPPVVAAAASPQVAAARSTATPGTGTPSITAPSAATAGAASTAEVPQSVPVAPADGGFVVQLGAFASSANAENFLARLAAPIAQVGVEGRIRQLSGYFRVFVGPYATRDEARRTADRLRDAFGLESTIAVH